MWLHPLGTALFLIACTQVAACRGHEPSSGEPGHHASAGSERAVAPPPDSAATARAVEQVRRAVAARRAGDAATAQAELAEASRTLAPVHGWLEVAMLRATREAGDTAAALDARRSAWRPR